MVSRWFDTALKFRKSFRRYKIQRQILAKWFDIMYRNAYTLIILQSYVFKMIINSNVGKFMSQMRLSDDCKSIAKAKAKAEATRSIIICGLARKHVIHRKIEREMTWKAKNEWHSQAQAKLPNAK